MTTLRSIQSRDPEICLSTYMPRDVTRSVLGHRRVTMVL